jgi:RNA polymerase sigma factor (TIGR02999 family)
LTAWSSGDETALDRLMPLVYQELHQRAERYMAYEQPGHTLQTTALVNELYLRLVDLPRQNWENRSHFLAICAQLMRRILVDFARSRRSQKRGGGPGDLPLNEALTVCNEAPHEIIAVDDALKSLSAFDPRKARVVELRFFGGLGVEETADILKISAETVMLRLEDGESLADSGSEERRKACRLSAGAGSKICIMPRYSSK